MKDHEKEILEIRTPTGINIEFQIAGAGGRSYAFIIDWHFRILLALAWYFLGWQVLAWVHGLDLSTVTADFGQQYVLFVVMPSLAIYFLYHPIFELLMRGNSPGKRMAKVQVLTVNGETPSTSQILVRNIFRLLDSLPMFYVVGLVCVSATRNSVRVGDIAANTILVYVEEANSKDRERLAAYAAETGLNATQVSLIQEWLDRVGDMNEPKALSTGNMLYERICKTLDKPYNDIDNLIVLKARFQNMLGVK